MFCSLYFVWFFYAFVFIKYTTNYDNFRLLRFINHYGCFIFVGVVYDLLVKVIANEKMQQVL